MVRALGTVGNPNIPGRDPPRPRTSEELEGRTRDPLVRYFSRPVHYDIEKGLDNFGQPQMQAPNIRRASPRGDGGKSNNTYNVVSYPASDRRMLRQPSWNITYRIRAP